MIPMTGLRFGRWLVVAQAPSDHRSIALWNCECECGERRVVSGDTLRDGRSKSCGCHRDTHRRGIDLAVMRTTEPDDSCLLWTGDLDPKGYGPYRRMYVKVRGPLSSEWHLDHMCRVRACINPDHLEPVTREENMRRRLVAHQKIRDNDGANLSAAEWLEFFRGPGRIA